MKALLVSHVSGFIPQFEMNNVKILQRMGYEVHYASNFSYPSYGTDNSRLNGTEIICHQIDFARNPFRFVKNGRAYHQLKKLMQEEGFSLVHCHTPIGGVLARIATHATKTAEVIYTAHGFHFYKGAPLLNWLFYYPVEKWLSKYTDVLITINEEDYQLAQKKFRAKRTECVPGVGIDVEKFQTSRKTMSKESILLLSVGELNKNKNHKMMLQVLAKMNNKNIHYWIAGHGELKEELESLIIQLGLEQQVKLLGYQNDIMDCYRMADIYVLPSLREGLNISIMEAMASGLPVICNNIRGNQDLIIQNEGGYLVNNDYPEYVDAIERLSNDFALRRKMGDYNLQRVRNFEYQKVQSCMEKIYADVFNYWSSRVHWSESGTKNIKRK